MANKWPKSTFNATVYYVACILLLWSAILLAIPHSRELIGEYWYFFLVGLGGAVAANSTGAGGGIVFIPGFSSLGIAGQASLGTSIAIQCFGMTAGSISWLYTIRYNWKDNKSIRLTQRLLMYAASSSVFGMICGQYLLPDQPFSIVGLFKYFSILFGCILLFISLSTKWHKHTRYSINSRDKILITVTGIIGGAITSWISVGAGELLALLFFFLGYPAMIAVCVAVCVSSLVVLSGVWFHIFTSSIIWEILLFAAPAALLGGSFAKFLSLRLGPVRLKIFFASWILATGLAMGS